MVTHYGNSACEGSSPYQLKMAAPAEVSIYEKCHFNIAANLTLNTMVSFIILLITRTARIACPDRQTERQNDRQNDKPSTVTLAAHARRGLITDTRGVGISSMRKSIYLLTTTPSSHTHRFHPLPLATPTSCSPHPVATPIQHSTHSPQLSSIL